MPEKCKQVVEAGSERGMRPPNINENVSDVPRSGTIPNTTSDGDRGCGGA